MILIIILDVYIIFDRGYTNEFLGKEVYIPRMIYAGAKMEVFVSEIIAECLSGW